jgi:hypothetical protein
VAYQRIKALGKTRMGYRDLAVFIVFTVFIVFIVF